jgi:hypothetical protein
MFERSYRTMTHIHQQSLNRVRSTSDFLVEKFAVIELPTWHTRQGGIAPTTERL